MQTLEREARCEYHSFDPHTGQAIDCFKIKWEDGWVETWKTTREGDTWPKAVCIERTPWEHNEDRAMDHELEEAVITNVG